VSNGTSKTVGLVFAAEELGLDLSQSLILAGIEFSQYNGRILEARKVLVERSPRSVQECESTMNRLLSGLLERN
jgi:hypothetical protein